MNSRTQPPTRSNLQMPGFNCSNVAVSRIYPKANMPFCFAFGFWRDVDTSPSFTFPLLGEGPAASTLGERNISSQSSHLPLRSCPILHRTGPGGRGREPSSTGAGENSSFPLVLFGGLLLKSRLCGGTLR